jgi:hypothetical protein
MSVWSEEGYGIRPEHIIGSYGQVKFEMRDGKPALRKTLDSIFVDDRDGKPAPIRRFIGRRRQRHWTVVDMKADWKWVFPLRE